VVYSLVRSNALISPLPSPPDTASGPVLWKPVDMLSSQRSPTSIEMHHEGGEESPGSTDSHTLTGTSITTARVGVRGPRPQPPRKGLATFSNILGPHLILIVEQVMCLSVAGASCSSRIEFSTISLVV